MSALPAGAELTIVVRYGGSPRPIRSLWGAIGFEELSDGVLVAGQPNGAASWFPCDDHPSGKANYRIQISTESPYTVIANGALVSRQAGSRRRFGRTSNPNRRRPTWPPYRSACKRWSNRPTRRCRYGPPCPRGCSATSATTSGGSRK